MAWTARIITATKSGGKGIITVRFTDGSTVLGEDISVSQANPDLVWLKTVIANRVAQLNSIATFIDTLSFNPSVDFDTTITPTQYETDLATFKGYIETLRMMLAQIRLGKKTLADADVQTAINAGIAMLQTHPEWKPLIGSLA